MESAQTRVCLTHSNLCDYEIQTNHPISIRSFGLVSINNENRNCQQVNFNLQVDHSVKIKESEKLGKYLEFI